MANLTMPSQYLNRVFFGGKTKRPCFDLFIHWLIKQITNTYRNQFSRSYENRSNRCLSLLGLKGRLNSQTSRLQNGSNQIQISLKKEFTTLCALSSINESGIKRVRQNFTPLFEWQIFKNYSSSPNGLWVNSASWATDSEEAMLARGIIVLVKSN